LKIDGKTADTFLRLDGFEKGFVMVNGFNIGRYYNSAGPQKTLYIPAPLLREGENEIIVFESDRCDEAKVTFLDTPELG
jgi:beta-galactosidase